MTPDHQAREFILSGGGPHMASFIHKGQEQLQDDEEILVREVPTKPATELQAREPFDVAKARAYADLVFGPRDEDPKEGALDIIHAACDEIERKDEWINEILRWSSDFERQRDAALARCERLEKAIKEAKAWLRDADPEEAFAALDAAATPGAGEEK